MVETEGFLPAKEGKGEEDSTAQVDGEVEAPEHRGQQAEGGCAKDELEAGEGWEGGQLEGSELLNRELLFDIVDLFHAV